MLIGLMGYARSGKDTLAQQLQPWGYEKIALADPVRAAVLALDPIIGMEHVGPLHFAEAIRRWGWEGTKNHPTYGDEYRRLLQRFGTEVGRETFGRNFWVDQMIRTVHAKRGSRIVITDVRFQNEADRIREMGGTIIRLERDDAKPPNLHTSETEGRKVVPDLVLQNNEEPFHMILTLEDEMPWLVPRDEIGRPLQEETPKDDTGAGPAGQKVRFIYEEPDEEKTCDFCGWRFLVEGHPPTCPDYDPEQEAAIKNRMDKKWEEAKAAGKLPPHAIAAETLEAK